MTVDTAIFSDDEDFMYVYGCPFCDVGQTSGTQENDWFWVECSGCGARGPKRNSKLEAINDWNIVVAGRNWED